MKKVLLLTSAILFSFIQHVQSQNIEIGGSIGYMMSGGLNGIYGEADVTNNVNFGGFTHIPVNKFLKLELLYLRKGTDIEYRNFHQNIRESYDLVVEYYHIGGVQTIGDNEKIQPFVSFSFGVTRFHLQESLNYNDEYLGSIAPSIGVKIYLSDRIGLQTQARLLMPLTIDGYGIFWSSSSGTSTGLTFHVPVWQGDFSGGLFIRL